MRALVIKIDDPEIIEALGLYKKDVQAVLVKKALSQLLADERSFGIAKLAVENGIAVGKQTRKSGAGRKPTTKKETIKPVKVPSISSSVGLFGSE